MNWTKTANGWENDFYRVERLPPLISDKEKKWRLLVKASNKRMFFDTTDEAKQAAEEHLNNFFRKNPEYIENILHEAFKAGAMWNGLDDKLLLSDQFKYFIEQLKQ